ncbi:PLC-like phosphodiesterase [Hygrophoropsis aurantiaca]|uniref:PLC-like phosphodiesterase n=1 Tax=Hygrophoropsis aurantiaca TaxID=72124 RepID=A0ACB8AAY6_9AGAM|nr:PLC-like phosphodiesterase [Hygrophoropsis aurantiaca]
MSLGAKWQVIKTSKDAPWIIYRNRMSSKYHRILIFPRRDMSCFLSDIPDTVPLSSLMLPGIMAFYGWPVSQCQSLDTPLKVQLNSGIRTLDIRLSIIDGRLISYHGLYPQRTPFKDILFTVHAFLTAPHTCRETIVMSIKQEDNNTQLFSKLVREEIQASPGGLSLWFLENRVPALGEVRGKVVMFSRFGGNGFGWDNGAIGIHPSTWPDSEKEGFTWECQNTLVQTQDWYAIPSFLSIPEKVLMSTNILLTPPDLPVPILNITYLSASSIPLALPPTIARGFGWPKWGFGFEGVNGRVGKWLLDILGSDNFADDEKTSDREPRVRGWAFMDFYEEPVAHGLVPLFVECNFRGRVSGEEGWP